MNITPDDFNEILDKCIDRVNRGESPEACLADYPAYAEELRPLLVAMSRTQEAYSFSPSDEAKRAARQRFFAEVEKHKQPSLWQRVLAQRLVWATAATILVVMIVGYLGLRTTVFQVEPPSELVAGPSAEGNFVFLVSDEVNAIEDFNNLFVTIDKVGLLSSGNSTKWIEFVPQVQEFDLALLPGETTQELWRGNVPTGDYTKVVIYVNHVNGELKATGETIDIKLPSNKLQISLPFGVSPDNITSFTYDLTVVHTGKAQGGERYQLKPQVGESGASQNPVPLDQDRSQGKRPTSVPDTSNAPSVNNNRRNKLQ